MSSHADISLIYHEEMPSLFGYDLTSDCMWLLTEPFGTSGVRKSYIYFIYLTLKQQPSSTPHSTGPGKHEYNIAIAETTPNQWGASFFRFS